MRPCHDNARHTTLDHDINGHGMCYMYAMRVWADANTPIGEHHTNTLPLLTHPTMCAGCGAHQLQTDSAAQGGTAKVCQSEKPPLHNDQTQLGLAEYRYTFNTL